MSANLSVPLRIVVIALGYWCLTFRAFKAFLSDLLVNCVSCFIYARTIADCGLWSEKAIWVNCLFCSRIGSLTYLTRAVRVRYMYCNQRLDKTNSSVIDSRALAVPVGPSHNNMNKTLHEFSLAVAHWLRLVHFLQVPAKQFHMSKNVLSLLL